jgi:hypothetical protein
MLKASQSRCGRPMRSTRGQQHYFRNRAIKFGLVSYLADVQHLAQSCRAMAGTGQCNKSATRRTTQRSSGGSTHPSPSIRRYVFSNISIGRTDRSASTCTWAHSPARCKANSSHMFQFRQRFNGMSPQSAGKSNGTMVKQFLSARSEVMLLLFNNQTQGNYTGYIYSSAFCRMRNSGS